MELFIREIGITDRFINKSFVLHAKIQFLPGIQSPIHDNNLPLTRERYGISLPIPQTCHLQTGIQVQYRILQPVRALILKHQFTCHVHSFPCLTETDIMSFHVHVIHSRVLLKYFPVHFSPCIYPLKLPDIQKSAKNSCQNKNNPDSPNDSNHPAPIRQSLHHSHG